LNNIKLLISIFPLFTARQLAQVTGKVISISPVVGNLTRLMSRYCYLTIESRSYWDENLDILYPQEVLRELKFWVENVHAVNRKVLASYCPSSVIMYSDASNLACGAYCVEVQNKVFHRMWNEIELTQSSTWRELKAIEQAIFTFLDDLKGKNIKWFTDNQNCSRIIKAGSMKQHLQRLALSIFSVCMRENISIEVQWIPRELNTKADYISKMIDHEDWGVSTEFFEFIDSLWGPHSVDRFASSLNNKTKIFNSLFWNPSTSAVDCFTQNWAGENNWLVPPIYSVVKAIKHLVFCKSKGSLIVPRWVSAPFWPIIFKGNLEYQFYVKDILEFTETDRIYVKGSNPKCLFGSKKNYSTVLAVRLDASL